MTSRTVRAVCILRVLLSQAERKERGKKVVTVCVSLYCHTTGRTEQEGERAPGREAKGGGQPREKERESDDLGVRPLDGCFFSFPHLCDNGGLGFLLSCTGLHICLPMDRFRFLNLRLRPLCFFLWIVYPGWNGMGMRRKRNPMRALLPTCPSVRPSARRSVYQG